MLEKFLAVFITFVLQFERYVDILEKQTGTSAEPRYAFTPEHVCKCHTEEQTCTLKEDEKAEDLDLKAALAKAREEEPLVEPAKVSVPAENLGEVEGGGAELYETKYGKFSREELFKRVTAIEGKEIAPKTRTNTLIARFNELMDRMTSASAKPEVNSLGVKIVRDSEPAVGDDFGDIPSEPAKLPLTQEDILKVLRELAVAKGKEVAMKVLLNSSDGARKVSDVKPELYQAVYDAAVAAKG